MPLTSPAFANPAISSQAAFRSVMEAMARPGTVMPLPKTVAAPAPLTPTAAAVALTLLDFETLVWLDRPLAASADVVQWFKFHTGARLTGDPAQAAYGFLADPARAPGFESFSQGSIEYPDRSTTLVLQVDRFNAQGSLMLSGPGISGKRNFSASPLPADFRTRTTANHALFPRGIDLILVTSEAVAALPRSVHVMGEA